MKLSKKRLEAMAEGRRKYWASKKKKFVNYEDEIIETTPPVEQDEFLQNLKSIINSNMSAKTKKWVLELVFDTHENSC